MAAIEYMRVAGAIEQAHTEIGRKALNQICELLVPGQSSAVAIHVDAQTLTHQIVWQKAVQIDDAEPARRGCHVLHLAQGAAAALATVGLSA